MVLQSFVVRTLREEHKRDDSLLSQVSCRYSLMSPFIMGCCYLSCGGVKEITCNCENIVLMVELKVGFRKSKSPLSPICTSGFNTEPVTGQQAEAL